MTREFAFYLFVPGFSTQLLLILYYFCFILPDYLKGSLVEDVFVLYLLLLVLLSPLSALLMGIANNYLKMYPNWVLHSVLQLPVPLTIVILFLIR